MSWIDRNALFALDGLVLAYVPRNTNDWREGLAALDTLRGTLGVAPAPGPKPLNGIAATMWHDEGARAQCGDCGRYTLNPEALTVATHRCECGSSTGWSGSFKKPGPDAKWSGQSPAGVPASEATWLLPDDMRALQRFHETSEDSQPYDVPKDQMRRLAELGVVQWCGGTRYSLTAFGQYMLDLLPEGWARLPLKTQADHDAYAAAGVNPSGGQSNG